MKYSTLLSVVIYIIFYIIFLLHYPGKQDDEENKEI